MADLTLQLTPSAQEPDIEQSGFKFPALLTEKYRPIRIQDFVGLDKIKRQMANLAAHPFPSAYYFEGPSGTGKTSLALALATEMPAELHHIASKECNLETVQAIAKACHWMPLMVDDWTPCKMHLVLVDEADQMTHAAQLAFLSMLDATAWPPNTVFIFTGNSVEGLEDRFLSRCQKLAFSSYGIAPAVTALLQKVWDAETDNPVDRPNFARIVKDNNNNVRGALMALQSEIMSL